MFREQFSIDQMSVIHQALTEGVPIECIEFLAKPSFTWNQMTQALLGFVNGLSTEEVGVYYNRKYTVHQMEAARLCMQSKVDEKNIEFLLGTDLANWQLQEARVAFINGMELNDVIEMLDITIDTATKEQDNDDVDEDEKELLTFFESCKNM